MSAWGTFAAMTVRPTAKVDGTSLTGVSETALMTLRWRATEARRPDSIINDPMAIHLVDSINFDFAKFGLNNRQDIAVRALAFDKYTRRFLIDHPSAAVVALAEGLQTSFYRLDAAGIGDEFRWLTVDLAPIIELRKKLLPPSERVTLCEQSALDFSWMDQVDVSDGVFITAEGLLMYLQPEDALELITECAKRFPGGQLMFDLAPYWLAAWTRRGIRTSRHYRAPPMPFSLSVSQVANLVNAVPGIRAVHDLPLPARRGRVFNTGVRTVQRLPLLDSVRPIVTLLEFG